MPRLAIVIPAAGTVEALETTLLAVLENRPVDCEIFAVTNFDYPDPYNLGDEVRFVAAEAGADHLRCAKAAIPLVRSSVIHVLAAGCRVAEGWTDQAIQHFSDLSVGAVAPVILAAGHRQRVVAAGVEYQAGGGRHVRVKKLKRLTAAGVAEIFGVASQAGFFRRSALEAVGGWSAEVGPQLADVELAWSLQRAGYRTLLEPAAHVECASLAVTAPSAFCQGLYAERLFWRHAKQCGWLKALSAHAFSVAIDTLTHAYQPSVVARLAGRVAALGDLRHLLRPAHVEEESPAETASHPVNARLRIDAEQTARSTAAANGNRRRMRSA